jgi:exocyst complex protein 7
MTKDRAVPSQYMDIYVEIRSFYIDKSLQGIAGECLKHIQPGKHKYFYEKGKHPFMTYTNMLLQMFDSEKTNIIAVFQGMAEDETASIYAKSIRPALSVFIQTGDNILRSKASNINCKDFADILELLDLSGFLTAFLSDNEEVFPEIPGKLSCLRDVSDLVKKYDDISKIILPAYLSDLEKPANRYPSVPTEATVHEISTDTINFLTKLENYEEIVENILSKSNSGSFIQYIRKLCYMKSMSFDLDLYVFWL